MMLDKTVVAKFAVLVAIMALVDVMTKHEV